MLDIAWPELIVIGVVALVAIGPKDLPKVMYTMGKWAAKLRAAAHDLRRAFDQVSYEAEIAEKQKKDPPPASPPLSAPPSAPMPRQNPPEHQHDAS